MKTIIAFFTATIIASTFTVNADPKPISLENYTFDFATIGYEIQVSGSISNGSEPLEGSDYTWLRSDGYKIKVRISPLSRKGKRDLTNYFNANCVGWSARCPATISGEVQLDEEMQVNFFARNVIIEGVEYK